MTLYEIDLAGRDWQADYYTSQYNGQVLSSTITGLQYRLYKHKLQSWLNMWGTIGLVHYNICKKIQN